MRGRRAILVIEGAMVILAAAVAARSVISLMAPLPVAEAPTAVARSAAASPSASVARSPFRIATATTEAVSEAPADDDIAESDLNLVLFGAWADTEGGSAIIGESEAKQKRYRVGDEIISGVRLDRVFADRVTIVRNGVREAVRMRNRAETGGIAAPTAGPSPTAAPPAVASPASFADFVRIRPTTDRSGVPGLALSAGSDASAFAASGLKDGDILVSVDGAPLSAGPAQLQNLTQRLAGRASVDIVVERDGARVPLSISLKKNEGR